MGSTAESRLENNLADLIGEQDARARHGEFLGVPADVAVDLTHDQIIGTSAARTQLRMVTVEETRLPAQMRQMNTSSALSVTRIAQVAAVAVVSVLLLLGGIKVFGNGSWAKENGITDQPGSGDQLATRDELALYLHRDVVGRDRDGVDMGHQTQMARQWTIARGALTESGGPGDKLVTRQVVVHALYVLAGSPETNESCAAYFADTPADHAFCRSIAWAYEQRIAKGHNGNFNPTKDVPRSVLWTMMERAHLPPQG